jgi:hypothetical protein
MKVHFFSSLSFALLLTSIPPATPAQWVQTSGSGGGTVYAFAVSGTNVFAGTWGGVFLSTDTGASWAAVNTGLTNLHVSALAVSGTNLFAGGSGVFLSTTTEQVGQRQVPA